MTNAHRRIAWQAAAVVLLGYLVFAGVRDFRHEIPVDLYYPWGLPIAQRHHVSNLNPYSDPLPYGEFLARFSKESTSRTLRYVGALWEQRSANKLEPIGTPLFYAAYSPLPEDFDQARMLFKMLQYAALLTAIYLLGRMRAWSRPAALAVAGFVGLLFSPFMQDVRVGNFNTLQLFVLTSLAYVSAMRLPERFPVLDYVWLSTLAILVLLKPNTLAIALALALHYLFVRGVRRFALAALAAAIGTALCFAYTAWHYGDSGVWLDWLRYIRGAQGGKLVYPSGAGNISLPLMFAERSTTLGVGAYGAIIAAMLTLAFVAVMTGRGKRPDLFVPAARSLLGDAGFVLSAGILATFATAPLVWQHYLLWAIVPIIWFFRFDGRWGIATWCAVASFIGFLRPMRYSLDNETYLALYDVLMLSWAPLLPAMLVYAAARAQQFTGRPAAGTPARPAGGGPG
jgi:hypothetical protein